MHVKKSFPTASQVQQHHHPMLAGSPSRQVSRDWRLPGDRIAYQGDFTISRLKYGKARCLNLPSLPGMRAGEGSPCSSNCHGSARPAQPRQLAFLLQGDSASSLPPRLTGSLVLPGFAHARSQGPLQDPSGCVSICHGRGAGIVDQTVHTAQKVPACRQKMSAC